MTNAEVGRALSNMIENAVDEALAGMKLPDIYRGYNMTNARADIQRVYEELK